MNITKLVNPVYVYRRRDRIMPYLQAHTNRIARSMQRYLALHGLPITENDRKLAALKDKHKGKRCFVIGNGPSLQISDLDRLKEEITFASNKIYLAFDQTDWRPTYYTVEDPIVAENNTEKINSLKGFIKILNSGLKQILNSDRSTLYINVIVEPLSDDPSFSINPFKGSYCGQSVLYMDIQLAFFMGFSEIYLIGVDFNFHLPATATKSKEILISNGEINHFHPDYRNPGETWYTPNLTYQKKGFEKAKVVLDRHNVKIFNATRGGKLEVFQRVNFGDLF
jgi:hypothetical protein